MASVGKEMGTDESQRATASCDGKNIKWQEEEYVT